MHVLGLFEIKVFFISKTLLFFLELHQSLFLDAFCVKAKDQKSLNFYTKTKLTPLEKSEFLAFFLN